MLRSEFFFDTAATTLTAENLTFSYLKSPWAWGSGPVGKVPAAQVVEFMKQVDIAVRPGKSHKAPPPDEKLQAMNDC